MNNIQKGYVNKLIETCVYRSLYSRLKKNMYRILKDVNTGTITTLIGKFTIFSTKSTYIPVKVINGIIYDMEVQNPQLKEYGRDFFNKIQNRYIVDLSDFRENEIYKQNLILTQQELITEAEIALDDIKDRPTEYTLCKYVYMIAICKIYSDEFLENYNLLLNTLTEPITSMEYKDISIHMIHKKPSKKVWKTILA